MRSMMKVGILRSLGCAAVLAFSAPAQGHTLHTLHDFCSLSACADGKSPNGNLVMDASGDLFGTTSDGGANSPGDAGTVFELVANPARTAWTYQVLYNFCALSACADGFQPTSGVILDSAGNLYGTTSSGGSNLGGVAYELSPGTGGSWTLRVLHNFCSDTDTGCAEGYFPRAGLTYAGASSGALYDGTSALYGVTTLGGPNKTASVNGGVAYSLTKGGAGNWKLHTLYAFCSLAHCADGDGPSSGLTVNAAGDLLGVTQSGGTHNWGTLFQIDPTHHRNPLREKVIFDFCRTHRCDFARLAFGTPALDAAGDILGTSFLGGLSPNCPRRNGTLGGTICGLVYKLSPIGRHYAENTVYELCTLADCTDGTSPGTGVLVDGSGNLLGATEAGGTGRNDAHGVGGGVVYSLNGTQNVLYNFCSLSACADGQEPTGVIADGSANLFGTANFGGAHGGGTVFELTP